MGSSLGGRSLVLCIRHGRLQEVRLYVAQIVYCNIETFFSQRSCSLSFSVTVYGNGEDL